MEQDFENRLKSLEKWRDERVRQQISYPLDVESQIVLAKYFMKIFDTLTYTVVGAEEHIATIYVGQQGNFQFQVEQNTLFPYTVNVASNIFTIAGGKTFANDTAVLVYYAPGGALPTPLAVNTTYYVVSSTGNSFKLSATVGGAAINITTTGTGKQFITAQL